MRNAGQRLLLAGRYESRGDRIDVERLLRNDRDRRFPVPPQKITERRARVGQRERSTGVRSQVLLPDAQAAFYVTIREIAHVENQPACLTRSGR